MPMTMRRLTRIDAYAMTDGEIVIVTTPTTSIGAIDLVGTAVKTQRDRWRVLRFGMVAIGYVTSATEAVDLITDDAIRGVGRPKNKRGAIEAVQPVGTTTIDGKGVRA
jgi:hypothetical protein